MPFTMFFSQAKGLITENSDKYFEIMSMLLHQYIDTDSPHAPLQAI